MNTTFESARRSVLGKIMEETSVTITIELLVIRQMLLLPYLVQNSNRAANTATLIHLHENSLTFFRNISPLFQITVAGVVTFCRWAKKVDFWGCNGKCATVRGYSASRREIKKQYRF